MFWTKLIIKVLVLLNTGCSEDKVYYISFTGIMCLWHMDVTPILLLLTQRLLRWTKYANSSAGYQFTKLRWKPFFDCNILSHHSIHKLNYIVSYISFPTLLYNSGLPVVWSMYVNICTLFLLFNNWHVQC